MARCFENMLDEVDHRFCWACGRPEGYRGKPGWWHGPFRLERAHIVNKPRVEDRRVCVILCSLCHRIAHGDRFTECKLPRLRIDHLLWLKRRFDRQFYDRKFMQRHSIRKLPPLYPIPAAYRIQLLERRKGLQL